MRFVHVRELERACEGASMVAAGGNSLTGPSFLLFPSCRAIELLPGPTLHRGVRAVRNAFFFVFYFSFSFSLI